MWLQINEGKFPKPIPLGGRAVGWEMVLWNPSFITHDQIYWFRISSEAMMKL